MVDWSNPATRIAASALLVGLVGWYPAGQGSVAALLLGLQLVAFDAFASDDRVGRAVAGGAVVVGALGLIYPLIAIVRVLSCADLVPSFAILAFIAPGAIVAPLVWLAGTSLVEGWIRGVTMAILLVLELIALVAAVGVVQFTQFVGC